MKHKVIKTIPCALALSMMLSGCASEKSECELINRHVHKYVKNINGQISIEKYIENEHMNVSGYNWTDNVIEVTSMDADYFETLESKSLFLGSVNWDFLYNQMLTHPDYLEYYYYYETVETYTTTDAEGHTHVHTRTVVHSGWTKDPSYWHNTGKVRLNHFRYFGYRVIYKDGKFVLEKSPEVDDVRKILGEYPYVSENTLNEVSETFRFRRSELSFLSPSDFDTFDHPDLTNKDINLDVGNNELLNEEATLKREKK